MASSTSQNSSLFNSYLAYFFNEPNFDIPSATQKKLNIIRNILVHDTSTLSIQDYSTIESLVNLYKECNKHPEDENLRKQLISTIDYFFVALYLRSYKNTSSEYNSESYYEKAITELNKTIDVLKKTLVEPNQSSEQTDEIKKELEERKEQIKQIKAEKEELEKKLDAQKNIKDKITDAFKELKNHISHLEKEKRRLNRMFYIYAFLCVCVLVILVYFEFVYLSKWETPTKLIDYLPFYIPVPIVGGLLWAFIYQMNRAQRQLMLVAYELYHVDYVEGLLQAINMVSPNVTSASEKIGNVLDVMIKKHITTPNELFENSLDKEISKDNIDLKTFVNIAKEVKDVIK